MKILYNSRDLQDKTPFGPLRAGESCNLRIRVPSSCGAWRAVLTAEGLHQELQKTGQKDGYDAFTVNFVPKISGLYFYIFHIWDQNGDYDLFRQGEGTNIGEGEPWQLSVLPADYKVPTAFQGSIYYQIFPDRFYKEGECDLRGKLLPYTLKEFSHFTPTTLDASDFAGGNLRGIQDKLDYISSLGTEVIYLNPIFMAASNHRYDTADYTRIDPMLGTEEDFASLCRAAHARDIRIVLDGVFSHTGRNSIYFDWENIFGGGAASIGTKSKYYKWYDFQEFPEKYTSWWGIDSLPCVNELDPDYMEFILGPGGVVTKWLRLGADGFRLDVADELPDEFVYALRCRVKTVKPEAVVIGEVWEDASNKVSYGVRRQYFTGGELDGVMNYPFRQAILSFLIGEDDGWGLEDTVMTLAENYPAEALRCTMTILGTHDTERIGTILPEKKVRWLAAFLQYTLPGSPVIYYGDEAGLLGGRDPMCRMPFPWGRENESLQTLYRDLASMRRDHPALRWGGIRFLKAENGVLRFRRFTNIQETECFVDRSSGDFWAKDI